MTPDPAEHKREVYPERGALILPGWAIEYAARRGAGDPAAHVPVPCPEPGCDETLRVDGQAMRCSTHGPMVLLEELRLRDVAGVV